MKRNELASLLRAIADCLEKASPEDIKHLMEGKLRFSLEVNDNNQATIAASSKTKLGIENIKQRLEQANSIEEGLQILREEGVDKRKQPLGELARSYEVGVRKSENMADLAYRIVNAVVGSRLHAETMRNLSLGDKFKE